MGRGTTRVRGTVWAAKVRCGAPDSHCLRQDGTDTMIKSSIKSLRFPPNDITAFINRIRCT